MCVCVFLSLSFAPYFSLCSWEGVTVELMRCFHSNNTITVSVEGVESWSENKVTLIGATVEYCCAVVFVENQQFLYLIFFFFIIA